jgi:hypothetical protein
MRLFPRLLQIATPEQADTTCALQPKERAASRAVNKAPREWPEIADIHVSEIDFIG